MVRIFINQTLSKGIVTRSLSYIYFRRNFRNKYVKKAPERTGEHYTRAVGPDSLVVHCTDRFMSNVLVI